jgi:hypothetical protein
MTHGSLELDLPASSSSPEEKLWGAVIALAIKDICVTPLKPNVQHKIKDPISAETASALHFLLTERSDWVFDALGFDGDAYRERTHKLMDTGDSIPWRNARINYQRYLRKTIEARRRIR